MRKEVPTSIGGGGCHSLIVSLFICASVYDSIREQIGDDTMDLILNAAGQQ